MVGRLCVSPAREISLLFLSKTPQQSAAERSTVHSDVFYATAPPRGDTHLKVEACAVKTCCCSAVTYNLLSSFC